VTLFGVLAVLVQLALWKRPQAALISWLFATLCGAADEIHQVFVPNRTPSLIDVGIDSFGALAALLLFHLVFKLGTSIIRKSDADF
jgi:VanZ family protein